jgi:hypothetical protein
MAIDYIPRSVTLNVLGGLNEMYRGFIGKKGFVAKSGLW